MEHDVLEKNIIQKGMLKYVVKGACNGLLIGSLWSFICIIYTTVMFGFEWQKLLFALIASTSFAVLYAIKNIIIFLNYRDKHE